MHRLSAVVTAALALAASFTQAQVTGDPVRIDGGLVSGV